MSLRGLIIFLLFTPQILMGQSNQIKGLVYLDRNANGARDSGDVLQPAVRIYLYEDINGNAILDSPDILVDSQFTDAGGEFSFSVSGNTVSSRISSNNDDAEELVSNGSVSRGSSDLELGFDGSREQIVGMRFRNITIPQGTSISSAYIEFECDEADNGTSNIRFYGQDSDNASSFTSSSYNISSRSKTTAEVNWNNIPAWTVNEKYQTPDLSSIIQEIINRSGWVSGNSLVIMADGSGERTAESRNGEADAAPLLVIEYTNNSLNYLVKVNTEDYSVPYTATSDTIFSIQFTGYGQTDSSISFGFDGSSVACYAADDGTDRLWMVNRFSGYHEEIGSMSVYDVEAIAADNTGQNLYATDGGQLGTLNRYTGKFTAFPSAIGSGNGVDGLVNFNDVDGLVFDPFEGALFGSVRRNSDYDLLIKIDTSTGQFVAGAFGGGDDYVEIKGSGFLSDIDDLAINPNTGQLYGINNNGGSNDYLVSINKNTGVGSIVSLIGVNDVEGLGITNDGLFYATTGDYASSNSNSFYQIDELSGSPTLINYFSAGNDYEACDCLLGHLNYVLLSLDKIHLTLNKINDNRIAINIQADNDNKGDIYIVERGGQNRKFLSIDSVHSQGKKEYTLYDEHPISGLNLYRIKHLTLDGELHYSEIKAIQIKNTSEEVLISPNPSDGSKLIFNKLLSTDHKYLSVEIFNVSGNLVYVSEMMNLSKTVIQFQEPLPKGMYLLKISDGIKTWHKEFIVQ